MISVVRRISIVSALAAVIGLGGCAIFPGLIQPPNFDLAPERTSELRIVGPAAGRPLGGAQVRIWAHVENPNAIGFTLASLTGHLLLEEDHAAAIDLPLGLPLPAASDTIVPLDVTISFADIPGIAEHLLAAVTGQQVAYALNGTISVDAGAFGQPVFGPSTWLRGELPVVR